MDKKQKRHNDLLSLVNTKERISIKELAGIYGVSELTIRRDIQVLEQQGVVQNIRGIVFANEPDRENKIYNLNSAGSKNFSTKNVIGLYAAKLIENDDIVIIDNGTTTERLAAHFPEDINATVLCYNINILNHLYMKPNISLIFGGGYFHPQTLMFESKESLELIRRTRAKKVFVSAAGVHNTLGVTCTSTYELESKREILKASMEKILLVDSSKFGQIHKNFICEFSMFDRIITDNKLKNDRRSRGRVYHGRMLRQYLYLIK
jgi:DeoR family deoxyribose operon repressor